MADRADYYALLARAVARLGHDSFEARGAIYDRARVELLKRLAAADPPCSDEDIAREQAALLDAIRKLEFEDLAPGRILDAARMRSQLTKPRDPLLPEPNRLERGRPEQEPSRPEHDRLERLRPEQIRPERSVAETNEREPGRLASDRPEHGKLERSTPEQSATEASVPEQDRRAPSRPADNRSGPPRAEQYRAGQAGQAEQYQSEQYRPEPGRLDENLLENRQGEDDEAAPSEPDLTIIRAPRRPVLPTIAGRMALAFALLGIGAAVLLFTQPDLLPSWLNKRLPAPSGPSERVAVAPSPASEAPAPALAQRAMLFEEDPTNPVAKAADGTVLWRVRAAPGASLQKEVTLDVEIPARELTLTMTIRPDADKTAISHLVEFQFAPSKMLPADAVANVMGVMVKKEERGRGVALAGQVVKVAPGAFLLGLSGLATDAQQNTRLLKGGEWLDIPIVHSNGTRMVLAIEKGETGASALDQILDEVTGTAAQ